MNDLFILIPKMLLLKNGVKIFLIFFQILNFSNYKNCLTLSSHISGLQALTENLKIVLKFSMHAL